jgi:uncharacterized protein
MIIDITSIAGRDDTSIDVIEDIKPMDLEHEILGITLTDHIHLEGKLSYLKGTIYVSGEVSGSCVTSCSRCLVDISSDYKVKIAEKYILPSEVSDDESYQYEGHFIDLSQALVDNILLSFPTTIVCEKDCKGLCPICGGNLNISQCDCVKQETNIKMEKLRDYFKK